MIIGIPKEIKDEEYRIGVVPDGVRSFVKEGHTVLIEKGAGLGSQIDDKEFIRVGGTLVAAHEDIYTKSDLIIKVKEPIESEYPLLLEGKILYAFLHLASNPALAEVLIKSRITAIAYETVQRDDKILPLLTPMSEIAGKLSIQEGARFLKKENGGRGILLGGIPGVLPAHVVILGGGSAGLSAAKIATGMGAYVTILDVNLDRLRYVDSLFGDRAATLFSNHTNICSCLKTADLVIGAVLIPGNKAPKIVTESMVKQMKKGSVIVDISIDQGGCIETSKPTSHENPTFTRFGVIHYCVTNIPGAVPITSTYGLTNVTLPYAIRIARMGKKEILKENRALKRGLNVRNGKVTHKGVASAIGKPYTNPDDLYYSD